MNIYANKQQSPQQQVNSVGKYLYKNLAGAFDFKKSANMFDVYTIVLYQIPYEFRRKYGITEDKYKEVYEMTIDINITTYNNKLRFNIIEQDPDEVTLGCKVVDPKRYSNFAAMRADLVSYLIARLHKRYEDYDFLF